MTCLRAAVSRSPPISPAIHCGCFLRYTLYYVPVLPELLCLSFISSIQDQVTFQNNIFVITDATYVSVYIVIKRHISIKPLYLVVGRLYLSVSRRRDRIQRTSVNDDAPNSSTGTITTKYKSPTSKSLFLQ